MRPATKGRGAVLLVVIVVSALAIGHGLITGAGMWLCVLIVLILAIF